MVAVLLHETLTPGNSWSPYYKVQTKAVSSEGAAADDHGQRGAAPAGGPRRAAAVGAAVRAAVRAGAAGTAGERADHRRRVGVGRGDRVEEGRAARGRGRDRPADPRHRQGAAPGPSVPGPAGHVAHRRRAGVPGPTDKKYDLILLALPDSLTLVNGASSLRLESYLFTEQAFKSAREHLNPGGAFAMYNYYREAWLIDRLASPARRRSGTSRAWTRSATAQAVVTAA